MVLPEVHGHADDADGPVHALILFEVVPQVDDEILDIGEYRLGLGRTAVGQLVGAELRHVDDVKIDRADRAVGQDLIAGGHIAEGDGMELGRHGDHRRRLPGMDPHQVLRFVDIADGLRQRAVVTDRAGQDIGNVVFFTGVHDAVVDTQGVYRRG